jgi:hypothetical protein
MSGRCVFNYSTNNCQNIYFFTDLQNGFYKVTKKKLIYGKYRNVKINGKKFIIILQSNYQNFITFINTTENTSYNRNIPIQPNYT